MKWLWLIIVALIIIVGAWFLFSGDTTTQTGDVGADVDVVGVSTTDMAPTMETITYDGSEFSPSAVVIKNGGTVTFVNKSDGKMWVASAEHPTHGVYSGTERTTHCPDASGGAFDQCAGETGDFTFTFLKAGAWGYHDHLNVSAFGKVTVVE